MNRWHGLGLAALLALVSLKTQAGIPEVEIGMYNVQNLFDTRHDKGKRDFEFLPKNHYKRVKYCKEVLRNPRSNSRAKKDCRYPVDWNAYKLDIKIGKIKEIFTRRGSGLPAVLMLSEVENQAVVRKLGSELGYTRAIVSNGPDRRGIDLAFLFRGNGPLKYAGTRSYEVNPGFATRPILEIEFQFKSPSLQGKSLFFYANHWPAQSSRGNTRARVIAAKTLRKIMRDRERSHPDSFLMAMGDFNTTEADYPNPINDSLLNYSQMRLFDVDTEYRRAVSRGRVEDKSLPEGTYYWKGNPRLFDRFIVSKSLFDQRGLDVKLSTYDIFARSFNSKRGSGAGQVPKRYNHYSSRPNKAGYSDHYPVFIKLGVSE